MTEAENRYFEWLMNVVDDSEHNPDLYLDVLETLFVTPFRAVLESDQNRIGDALMLRDDFCDDCNESGRGLQDEVSCLEVMIALADRIEDDIMCDAEFGDRRRKWFWLMVKKLGLDQYKEGHFNQEKVDKIIDDWVNRRGNVGLFGPKFAVKNVEIWDQMLGYFSEKV